MDPNYKKYVKYKNKYLSLKNQKGGNPKIICIETKEKEKPDCIDTSKYQPQKITIRGPMKLLIGSNDSHIDQDTIAENLKRIFRLEMTNDTSKDKTKIDELSKEINSLKEQIKKDKGDNILLEAKIKTLENEKNKLEDKIKEIEKNKQNKNQSIEDLKEKVQESQYEEELIKEQKQEEEQIQKRENQDKQEKDKQEREKQEREKQEKEKQEKEKQEREKQEKDKQEKDKQEREKQEKDKQEREKQEKDKQEKNKQEKDKQEKDKKDKELMKQVQEQVLRGKTKEQKEEKEKVQKKEVIKEVQEEFPKEKSNEQKEEKESREMHIGQFGLPTTEHRLYYPRGINFHNWLTSHLNAFGIPFRCQNRPDCVDTFIGDCTDGIRFDWKQFDSSKIENLNQKLGKYGYKIEYKEDNDGYSVKFNYSTK
jgi:chemotaxis protein histidine kinase CheA